MYEPKLVKEQEVRKSWSQISLEERKTKKLSQKNSAKKKALSVAATEATSWQQTKEETPRVLKKREGCFFFILFLFTLLMMLYPHYKTKPPLLSTVILIDGKKSYLFVCFYSVQQLEPPTITSTSKGYQSPRQSATTQLTAPETHAQPTQLVGSKVMKKYMGNGQMNRNPTGLVRRASLFVKDCYLS